MTSDDFIKLLGQGGVTAALLFILGKIIWRVADRMITAIDRISAVVAEHTKTDLEHHADVKEVVARMDAKLDATLDWQERTPVDGPPKRPSTNSEYSYPRKRKDD